MAERWDEGPSILPAAEGGIRKRGAREGAALAYAAREGAGDRPAAAERRPLAGGAQVRKTPS